MTFSVPVRAGAPPPPSGTSPGARAYLHAVAIVAAWMAAGWLLEASPNEYLLLGVSFTLFLHSILRRQPLYTLWVRDAATFRLGRRGWTFATLAAIAPVHAAGRTVMRLRDDATAADVAIAGWLACALLGAVGAGFAIAHFRRLQWTPLLRCLATAGLLGSAVMVAAWLAQAPRPEPLLTVAGAVRWFFLYVAVGFVLEEVFFRGALDAYLYRPGAARGWLSAFAVSALWGAWHLPTTPLHDGWLAPTIWLVGFHTAIGVPLSLYWRRSGNLLVPVTAHALIDAVRNALLG